MCTLSGAMAIRGPSSSPAAAAGAVRGARAGPRPPRGPRPSLAPSWLPQHLARIHDAVWVERALHGAHERELDRGRVALELADLESPDAVLGAEAATELAHQVVDGAPRTGSARTGKRSRGAPGAALRLKCRLPSPTWP